MKNIFALFLFTLILSSCSLEDDSSPNFQFDILPVESVVIPEVFTFGETAEIRLTYLRPTSCHAFNEFFYDIDGNNRTVAIVTTVVDSAECVELTDEEVEVSFDFLPTAQGSYVFRFWQGEDESGLDSYYIVEVPVVE